MPLNETNLYFKGDFHFQKKTTIEITEYMNFTFKGISVEHWNIWSIGTLFDLLNK
jgi:hypothetical protein